jgi:ERCC4-type nuclease
MKPTKLILDSREKMPALEKNFSALGYQVSVEALPCGDIMVPEAGILAERKTVTDLLGSIASKRLMAQLDSILLQDVEHKILIIEGVMARDWAKGQMKTYMGKWWRPSKFHPASINNLLWSYAKKNVRFVYTTSIFDTCNTIGALVQNELKDDHRVFDGNFKSKAETPQEVRLRVISSLPHISVTIGSAILAFYHDDVIAAFNDIDNWATKIDGVGKKTVDDIKASLVPEKAAPNKV